MQMSAGQGSLDEGLRPTWFGRDERLELIRASIDWDAVGARLASVHVAEEGRPAFPTVPMVRVLLLQRWTGASDQATARSLRSDASRLAFTGLGMERRPPDASTICRFRNLVAEAGLASEVFEEIARQLAERGLVLKQGSITDSTIVETARRPRNVRERARGSPLRPGRGHGPQGPSGLQGAHHDGPGFSHREAGEGREGRRDGLRRRRGDGHGRRVRVLRRQGLQPGRPLEEAAVDGDQGPDDAEGEQAPRASEALEEAPQRDDRAAPGACGIGLRDVQAQPRDAACSLHGPRQGLGPDPPDDGGLQPGEDAQADAEAGAGVGPHRFRTPSARPEAPKPRRNRRIRRRIDQKQPSAPKI